MSTTFENAKVGDKVWVRLPEYEGPGEITAIDSVAPEIEIDRMVNCDIRTFAIDGSYYLGGPQCLFWAKPEIIAPEGPKRANAVSRCHDKGHFTGHYTSCGGIR